MYQYKPVYFQSLPQSWETLKPLSLYGWSIIILTFLFVTSERFPAKELGDVVLFINTKLNTSIQSFFLNINASKVLDFAAISVTYLWLMKACELH